MPRLFGSSPGSSKRQQQQQQEEESNRRSNFTFMKYSSERTRTPSSMRKSREHAKQIAQQLSEQSPKTLSAVTSPTVDDVGAYNMDVIQSSKPSTRRKKRHESQGLNAFVQQQQQQQESPFSGPSSVTSESIISFQRTEHVTGNSMPTFPSNSTMQSRNISVSTSSSSAAARRRMARAQKQASIASRSDVGMDYDALEDNTTTTSLPYPLTRSASGKANHLLNYAQTPRAPIDARAASSTRSINSSSSSDNAFGFSFNAFGLDETLVDMEVNEALQSLQTRPFGFDFSSEQEQEEFPVTNFDSSSREASTPTLEMDGFTHGFRLVQIKQQAQESPTSSEQSSLTANTNEFHTGSSAVNRFKVQAGFHSSSNNNRGRPPVSPNVMNTQQQQYAKSEPGGPFPFTSNKFREEQFPEPDFPEDDPFPDPEPNIHVEDSDSDDYGPPRRMSPLNRETTSHVKESSFRAPSPIQTLDAAPPHSEVGAYSDAGAPSDVGVMGGTYSDVGARSDVGVNSEVGYKSDIAIASDVGVASDGGVNSEVGQVPTDIMGKLKRTSRAEAQREAAQAHQQRVEQEEEEEAKRVADLKHAWERRQQAEADEAAERLKKRQSARSPLPRAEITRLENQLGDELLSPEILEQKRVRGTTVSMLKSVKKNTVPDQARRSTECEEQRTSFASYRQRLKPAHERDDGKKDYGSAKSDIGGYGRPSPAMNSVLNRFNRQRSFGDSPQESYGDTRSDVGSNKPSFLANVKLRNTGRSDTREDERMQDEPQFRDTRSSYEEGPSRLGNDFDDSNEFDDSFGYNDEEYYDDEESFYSEDELEWTREQQEADFDDSFDDESIGDEPKPRKMTYREKRELELKAERERKEAEAKAKKEPERDVAALIRKRIAANKKAAAQAERDKKESTVNIADIRNNLRKVPADENESPREPPSAAEKFIGSSPKRSSSMSKSVLANSPAQPPSAAQKFLENSPEFSVKGSKKTPTMDKSPVQASPSRKESSMTVVADHEWAGSGESTSPTMHPPSMASTEADSSSTARTFEELSANLNQKRHLATEVPVERSVPSESVRHEPVYIEEQEEPGTPQHVTEEKPVRPDPPGSSERLDPPATGTVEEESISASSKTAASALNALLGKRLAPPIPVDEPEPAKEKEEVSSALMKMHFQQDARRLEEETSPERAAGRGSRPALKDDPKYARYFRMLKVGMPMDVVKHAMTRDDLDPSVMDGDHNKPAGGIPLKEDPKFQRYFKMLAMGLPMGAVKNAMERDGLDPAIMDGDHNLPAGAGLSSGQDDEAEEDRPKDTHRRTRLHWETLRQVRASSLWAKIDNDPELEEIHIDEEEFAQLFQAELTPNQPTNKSLAGSSGKRKGAAVRVIESKRANNGGIILARLKMTHDEMADAVDRIDENVMTAEQMEHIIEYLPTKEERSALEAYMLEGEQDAADKFDGLCECEKFMVAMMTVKHAKRKVRALLFKLQFEGCLDSLEQDVNTVESACDELKNSERLRKLLGIVLNIGNRLNTAGATGKRKAGAFSLNSLLKLSQAKAFDKKTTFLQYVVLVVQRNNEILLDFKDDIPTALKADKIYWDQCLSDLEDVENQLENVRRMALYQARLAQMYRLKQKNKPSKGDGDDESLSDASMTLEEEVESLRASGIGLFTLSAIKKVSTLRDKVEATKVKFSKLLEYFGEEHRRDMQPHDLFDIIATFSRDFDKAKETVIAEATQKKRDERRRQRKIGGNQTPRSAGPKGRGGNSPDDSIPSPKSDAGVRYSSYPDSFMGEKLPSPRLQSQQRQSSPSRQQQQRQSSPSRQQQRKSSPMRQQRKPSTNSMQQHSSTMNGMYSTPKQPLSTEPRRRSGGGSRDREASLRQKARMRRRMGQQHSQRASAHADGGTTPEEGRPPRSAEKQNGGGSMSPRSSIRKQRREEQQRRSTANSQG